MRILIHTCCADCLLNILKGLDYKPLDIVLYYYNPNIHPRSEYYARLKALKTVLQKYKLKLIIPDYKPQEYFEKVIKSKDRCPKCWELRLRETFEYANKNNIPEVTTTLLASHYQEMKKIIEIGERLSKECNINFIIPQKIVCELHKGFYKQNYCGCCYSLTERLYEKYSVN